MQELDPTDRRILLALDEDPRLPIMVLAQKLGLARGTVQSPVHCSPSRLDPMRAPARPARQMTVKATARATGDGNAESGR